VSSWGHTLRRLTDAETAQLRARDAWWETSGLEPPAARYRDTACRIRGCVEPATHEGSYRYVTGRAGRVSWARRLLCDRHADRFRAKHHPEPGQPSGHAPAVAVRQVLDADAAGEGLG